MPSLLAFNILPQARSILPRLQQELSLLDWFNFFTHAFHQLTGILANTITLKASQVKTKTTKKHTIYT